MASMLSHRLSFGAHILYETPTITLQSPQSSDSVVVLSSNYIQQIRKLNRLHPQYRNSRTGARSTRTQIDHDVFEGLPVHQWRKKPIKVDIAPEKENADESDPGKLQWKELQMPRDSHLLPQVSQDLLRAARMPQVKKQAVPLPEDEKELGEEEDADGEVDTGFVAKRWALVPKELEKPEPEYLAKRRKGLPSAHSGALAIAPMRKIKVRKIDADGHSSVWEVLVPEGQTVDGEVVEGEFSPTQAPAPGTVVQGVGIVNAEGVVIAGDQGVPGINKRRPPPPKRKPKGPGRGRKKKVAFAGADGLPTTNVPDGAADGAIKIEDGKGSNGQEGTLGGHTEMANGSLLKDDEQDGDEGSEEGSEEDEGEEGDGEEGELSPSASPSRSSPKPPPSTIAEAGTALERQDSDMTQPPSKDQIAATYPARDVSTENATEYAEKHTDAYKDEPMDEMLDEAMHEQMLEPTDPMDEILDGSTVEAARQHPSDYLVENLHGSAADSGMESVVDAPSEALAEDVIYKTEVMDDLPTQTSAQRTAETAGEQIYQPTTTSPPITVAQPEAYVNPEPSTSAAIEPVVAPAMDTIEKPATVPVTEPMFPAVSRQINEALRELTPKADPSTTVKATMGTMTEPEALTKPIAKQEIEATPDLISELLPANASQIATNPATECITEVPGGSSADYIAKTFPEPENEATDERMSDPLADIQTYTERKYSITRPTASPKAPTPSPPTPIETKFSSLQPPEGPYVSPKAPTMSPPTPIQRSMSSSPEISLLGQPFQLPPQIDVVHEAPSHPILGMHQIPDADLVSVEAAPEVESNINAQVPVDRNPLDGMTEPTFAESKPGQEADGAVAQFSDGDEDLLGGLERSLGPRHGL